MTQPDKRPRNDMTAEQLASTLEPHVAKGGASFLDYAETTCVKEAPVVEADLLEVGDILADIRAAGSSHLNKHVLNKKALRNHLQGQRETLAIHR